MADLSGYDDEFAELKKLNQDVLENSDDFEPWEKLVRTAESIEGGLNRNSSPQAIAATREIYDRFLAQFPLFFGYWKKYADLEFAIAGTESAEMIYERGTASIGNSVDLWQNYCAFKVETSHDADIIRELFERGASAVGLDFLSHPFWDKYIEFEERQEDPRQQRIFDILNRVIHIPMHQYARYFERYRQMAQHQPVENLLEAELLSQFRSEVIAGELKGKASDADIDRALRTRIDNFHLEVFHRTQTETSKRWPFEQEIKRPYFHVTELDEAQLINWRKYLDFEEVEGDYARATFLYERCLVACAQYEEFWLRYARWMYAQDGKDEEVRNIYNRASCLYVPISRPAVRLNWAMFEELHDRADVAIAIYEAMLDTIPGHLETIVNWANMQRRQGGLDAAIAVYKAQLDGSSCSISVKGELVAEWAKLLWKIKGSADEAREVFVKNAHWYMGVRSFWIQFFFFELDQPTSSETEHEQYERIKHVMTEVRKKGQLPPSTIKDLAHYYMIYLLERGTKDAAREYMDVDREVNGPFSTQTTHQAKLAEDGSAATTKRRMVAENGHPGVEVNEAAVRKGESPYTKYYQQQGEYPTPASAATTGAAPSSAAGMSTGMPMAGAVGMGANGMQPQQPLRYAA